ncbi:class I SAM-dependent methyltransferase [Novosphingobium sp. FSY-8]|uniref:Class I SAM-dependent methyltransferase n=1 Tax=Novosphingobium ovatum TaxID=1908523 RepID=A0ABW9XEX2_9SPHN|nr:SAM-dependent methyltransferase [Novosphingobium ovatum]NBC37092.1 class I SAM-dependent methyltransferase [Novosphingobium ovatum]
MADDTALGAQFRRLIANHGAIPITLWMAQANAAYYAARDPLGAAGDFITAPEISQMFGEMVGIALADVWRRAGAPADVLYVEPGPGRGTLARDALRVAARFGLRPRVHFVETSPVLRQAQAGLFPDAVWHDDLGTIPDDAPILLVANEFLDALPLRQLVRTPQGWRERMVGLDSRADDARFVPVAGNMPMDAAVRPEWRDLPAGTIVESCPAAAAVMGQIGARLAAQGGAALVIDYGHATPQVGSSLQALRAHAHADPFADPGSADLTWLVDFATAADAATAQGARACPLATQGDWLAAMGMGDRARALIAAAPDRTDDVGRALHRLTAPDQMGTLFKVLGLFGGGWPAPHGFPPAA